MIPKKFNNKIPRPSKSRESQNSVTIDSLHLIAGYVLGQMIRTHLKNRILVQDCGGAEFSSIAGFSIDFIILRGIAPLSGTSRLITFSLWVAPRCGIPRLIL